jgi:hypothetical protein
MGPPRFETVADALLPCADAVFEHLRTHGYKVRRELADQAAPFTPTMTAKRHSTTLHIEVGGRVEIERLCEWKAYATSKPNDTRLSACVPVEADILASQIAQLTELGIGLFMLGETGIAEIVQATDLAMSIPLPKLTKLPAKVRTLLGHSYEQFDRGEWREGFENACNALEEEARRYLAHWTRTGRIKLATKSGPKQLTATEIRGYTLGRLAVAYRAILTPNSLDVAVEHALTQINPDRVERVHRRSGKRTETRLRKNVGQHMWLIAGILKQLTS